MKSLLKVRSFAIYILLACVLLSSCDAMSERTCHLAAKEYAQQKGYDIDTALYNGYHSLIITKDSTILWINSNDYSYPFVKDMEVLRAYAR